MKKAFGGVGLALIAASVVFACGSSDSREGFDESGNGSGNGVGNGNENGNGNGNLGNAPPPAAPAEKTECEKMDIVFIVDDSGSMQEEQSNLAANFPKFVQKIDSFKTKSGSKLDWRLAVTTTGRNLNYKIAMPAVGGLGGGTMAMSEKGDDGKFRSDSKCGVSKPWVEKADSSPTTEFQCLAKVGTGGSSIEMPLLATKLATVDRVADGSNKGFLREDALLAVVILTDEDDCSREDNDFTIQNDSCDTMQNVKPVAEYKAAFDKVAQGAGRWATAVIAGDKQCDSSFGKAIEAKRLKEFVSLAGKNGTFSSICDGDLTNALEKALDTFDAACKALPPANVK